MARPYQLKQRAARQRRTREKIVEAAIELHQEKGVAATSMRDIAAKAKVGTVTVYRHFPDEAALVGACSGTYFERHPFPDLERWRAIADPRERLRAGLTEAYAYHRATAPMIAMALDEARDAPIMAPYHAYWREAAEVLLAAWPKQRQPRKQLKAALSLAVSFDTWRILVRDQGLSDEQAIDLMVRLVGD